LFWKKIILEKNTFEHLKKKNLVRENDSKKDVHVKRIFFEGKK
jgi:hypothetical protein